jgi:hypothetical protein
MNGDESRGSAGESPRTETDPSPRRPDDAPRAKVDVRAIVSRDLGPVRPLWPPSRRALALAPLAIAIVVGVPVVNFYRSDLAALGFVKAWGLSVVESAAGLAIVALGLREAIPGRALRRSALLIASLVGLLLPLVIYRVTTDTFNVGPRTWSQWRFGMVCFRTSVLAATPVLLASAFLTKRAFPLHRVATGILWGLGCGLIADAGLRLYCEFTTLPHMMLEHFSAVVASMLLGVMMTSVVAPPSRPKQ